MKKYLALTMTALILTTGVPIYADSETGSVPLVLTQTQSQGDLNLVSVREICTLLGYPLSWNVDKRELTIKSTLGEFVITPGVKAIRTKDNPIVLNTAPQIINGTLFAGADLVKAVSERSLAINGGKLVLETASTVTDKTGSYTVAQLYDMAVRTDKTVKKAELELDRVGIVLDRVETNFSVRPITYGTSAEDSAALGALNALESTRASEKLLINSYLIAKDTLNYKIKAAYEDIISGQGNLAYLEQVIRVTEKEVKFGELKLQLGTMSSYELNKLKTTLAGYKSKIEMQRLSIENAYEKLNNLTGLDKAARYTVSLENSKVEEKKVNLDSKIAEVLGVSPAIGSLETTVGIAQNNSNFYVYNAGGDPLSAKLIDVDKAKLDLASAKQSLKRAVEELVINRDSIYQQYQAVQNDRAQAEKDLNVAELNFKVGLISELDYQKAMLKLAELNQTDLTTHISIDKLDRTIEKPWISTN